MNKNWIFTILDEENNVVETLRIMDRTEDEAKSEAESYMENVSPYKDGDYDWSMVESKNEEELQNINEL